MEEVPVAPRGSGEAVGRGRLGAWLAPTLVGLFSVAVYAATIGTGVPPGDSGDFIIAAATGGIPHPPGYPLFTGLARLAVGVLGGDLAWRVSLFNALCGVGAALGVYAVARALGARRAAAAVGALLFAYGATVWQYAVVTEVFSLHLLAVAVALVAVLRWRSAARGGARATGWLVLLGLSLGLGASNQHTVVLIVPAVAYLLAVTLWGWPWRRVVGALATVVVAGFIGLLPYLYLPWAAATHPALSWGDPSTWQRFVRVLLRSDYGSVVQSAAPAVPFVAARLADFAASWWWQFLLPGAVLGCLGFVVLFRRARVAAWTLLLTFLVPGPLFTAWLVSGTPDLTRGDSVWAGVVERFYLASYVPWAVAVGVGTSALLTWLDARLGRSARSRRLLRLWGAVGLVLVVTFPLASNGGAVSQRGLNLYELYADDVLRSLPPRAVLLLQGDLSYFSVGYRQLVEGARPDVTVVEQAQLHFPWYVEQVRRRYPDVPWPDDFSDLLVATVALGQRLESDRPLLVQIVHDGSVGALSQFFEVRAEGLLFRLYRRDDPAIEGVGSYRERQNLFWASSPFGAAYVPDSPKVLSRFRFRSWRLALADEYAAARRWYAQTLTRLGVGSTFVVGQLEEAVRLNPGKATYRYDLGLAYERDDRLNEAVASYRAAVAEVPSFALAYRALAELYRDRLGDLDQARSYWNLYRMLTPEAGELPSLPFP